MVKHIKVTFGNDEDAERFLTDVKRFGAVPIPDGRHYGEYPCTAEDITEAVHSLGEHLHALFNIHELPETFKL